MLIEQTLEKLTTMKLGAMAEAVQQQLRSDEATALSFEDRLGVLVDTEWTAREQRKLTRRLRAAKLRYPASLEAVDFTHPRRLKRQQVVSLGSCAWIADRHNRSPAQERDTRGCRLQRRLSGISVVRPLRLETIGSNSCRERNGLATYPSKPAARRHCQRKLAWLTSVRSAIRDRARAGP